MISIVFTLDASHEALTPATMIWPDDWRTSIRSSPSLPRMPRTPAELRAAVTPEVKSCRFSKASIDSRRARGFSLFFTVGLPWNGLAAPNGDHRRPDRPKKRRDETRRGTCEGTGRIIGKSSRRGCRVALRRLAPSIGEPMSTSPVVKSAGAYAAARPRN